MITDSVSSESVYTFIEGVADEVVLVFVAGLVILFTVLAWQSTHVRQHAHSEQEQPHVQNQNESAQDSNSRTRPSSAEAGNGNEQLAADAGSSNSSTASSASRTSDLPNTYTASTTTSASSAVCGCSPIVENTEITVRIKYLDDRVREVRCRPHLTVGEFKTEYFAEERAANLEPRLIFNGRELRSSERCLHYHGVSQSGATIHCLPRPQRNESDSARSAGESDLDAGELFDLGRFMMPLFGMFLIAIWYARVAYRHYFTAISTCALLSISFLFVVACIIVYSNSQNDVPTSSNARSSNSSATGGASTASMSRNEANLRAH